MKATKENPIYTVYVISGDRKYNVTGATDSLDLSQQEKQIAQTATVSLADTQVSGKWLSDIISERDRVFIYANDGEQSGEVFRGFVWTISDKASTGDDTFTLKCYDNLIYFQESDEYEYFSSGKSTKSIISSLCSKWGVSVDYDYDSITHSQLVLRGALADVITADVLDLVKARTGTNYVVRSEKDRIQIKRIGSNTTIYTIAKGKNAIEFKRTRSMDGMITKVVILGKADNDDRAPVEATVKGNTDKYGTLQKLINRNENTSLADAKREAQSTLNEKGAPSVDIDVKTVDIPWIKKGDKVRVDLGRISGLFIVKGVDREISNKGKKMTLTLTK